ncbi:MAG: OmpA family protein [Fimbriimonadaceae bacterium]
MKIKPLGKFLIFIVILGAVVGGARMFLGEKGLSGLIPGRSTAESMVPAKVDLPRRPGEQIPDSVRDLSLPGKAVSNSDKPEMRMLLWAWNSQMGLMFANGGASTTKGSFMDKYGVNLKLERQDMVDKMQEGLVTFATEYSQGNKNPSTGAHFVAIMGDGAAAFLAGLNANLKKIGPEYQAKVIASCGYSTGEDKFMGPKAWKDNPEASKGGLVAGVLRDGDWNIAQKWLGDNGLKNNPDEKTWDPDALNWVAANDYLDAAEKYIVGYSEERDVVRNGKLTGQKKRVTVQGSVTWTPGDVNIAKKKGGIVSIVSTKEYSSQMPNVIIGIDKWMKENRKQVESMIRGISDGGDAVSLSSDAIRRAGEISQEVYNENGADAEYWVKYYSGAVEVDKTNQPIELGGSDVNNVRDMEYLFGLVPGTASTFEATYTKFGDVVVQQYPDLVPSYPSVSQILDKSYVAAVARIAGTKVGRADPTPDAGRAVPKPDPSRLVSEKVWKNIKFETGKATFTASTMSELNKLLQDLLIASGASVEIHGHTDNVGEPTSNMQLSEARAFAVKHWLEKVAGGNFRNRIKVIAHGQSEPRVPNTSEGNRAINRRVEIRLLANK